MSYIVMECHSSYAILLDEEGRFLKAANLHYQVGQKVCDPVLMEERPSRRFRPARWIAGGGAAIAACFLLVFGAGYYQNHLVSYSSIYLTINPEIRMELNRIGEVLDLEGLNEDGKLLLEGYEGRGKDKTKVTDELIDRAIEMGFLSEGGQISFSIDSPDEALFQEYGEELKEEVNRHLKDRFSITIEIIDPHTGKSETTAVENPVQEETQPEPQTETGAPAASQPETAAPRHPEIQIMIPAMTESQSIVSRNLSRSSRQLPLIQRKENLTMMKKMRMKGKVIMKRMMKRKKMIKKI